jgi:hypothetical protein
MMRTSESKDTRRRSRPAFELVLDGGGCYIVTSTREQRVRPDVGAERKTMPTNVHPHRHHHPGQGHPPASVSPSMLRMSVLERLAVAAALIALLWGAVFWAMQAAPQ